MNKNHSYNVKLANGKEEALDIGKIRKFVSDTAKDIELIDQNWIIDECLKNIFNGIKVSELHELLIMNAKSLIEKEPNYSIFAARLLIKQLNMEICRLFGIRISEYKDKEDILSRVLFIKSIEFGVQKKLLNKDLLSFDLELLSNAIDLSKDLNFNYLGIQTLYDRYFLHSQDIRFESPQIFFMRVSMGLAIKEKFKNEKAIEFYKLISSFDFMSSTPTLFNSGTNRSQLSSCYISTVPDDLGGIYESMKKNALLSKYSGGLGNDWTQVRGTNSHIKGTNGKSQGIIPFLKVANDTAVAVNQGGKRKGALCVYLETWHIDIEEFLELHKNTGDERRRTYDIHTANWIPDIFMKRVFNKKEWTLFSPNDVIKLHKSYGKEFDKNYIFYEKLADQGAFSNFKRIPAVKLWRKMLSMLFETGHPWITFKDPCNIRSPQQHTGIVHSSNLCTEITLNTSNSEIAVCNLGSINLSNHLTQNDNKLDIIKLKKTVKTAIRMLDNVIDINYYSVPEAYKSNMNHRPIGLGIMGFQDALYKMNMTYNSHEAMQFSDISMEYISYFAIKYSSELAAEKGFYKSYKNSLWSKGILPIDSMNNIKEIRGKKYFKQDGIKSIDWNNLRKQIKLNGMRNSNVIAIAPTATISNICGIFPSIEPIYKNLYVKSNLSGEFTVINRYLVQDLKKKKLWNDNIINEIKYYNGSIKKIKEIPKSLRDKFLTAFEIDPKWLIQAASKRQKWIDQSQSLNLYISEASGKKLDNIYSLAWLYGLKTTYYLRSMGASDNEKSTINNSNLNAVKNERLININSSCESCE